MKSLASGLLIALAVVLPLGSAMADDRDGEPLTGVTNYVRGEVLPQSLRAERNETALVVGSGGYDGAREAAVFDLSAEIHVWGPFTLRGGATYVSNEDDVKPTIGAIAQLFRTESGLAGSFGIFYKPEGLTEPEGEIEANFALGLRFERGVLIANFVYGQDGESEERDGEVRVGGVYRVSRSFMVGADARFRFDLGSEKAGEPDYDIVAGPLATYLALDTAFTVQVGVSAVKLVETKAGPIAILGVGRLF